MAVPEARTRAGTVRGRQDGAVAAFLGIPFAEPPVGRLRLAAPQPARPWDGVRDATAYGPPPPQSAGLGPFSRGEAATGDDWLTVNVWSPRAEPGAGLPVMVWIYGGAYLRGHAGEPGYAGTRLAGTGGIVVVSLNYRVGVEGFAHIEGAPANRGLLDQVAALVWVRDNIAEFGGDPGNVTVFGESAGAGSVAALLAMDRAAGLFRRAITQSVPGTYFSAELAADVTAAVAGQIGRRPDRADLAAVPPDELVAAGDAVTATIGSYARWGPVSHTPTPFSPVVDGDVLPRTPWDALAAGAGRGVELIAGHNRDEYRLFIVAGGKLGKVTGEEAATALRVFGPGEDPERAYRAAYPGAGPERLYELVHSDWLFRMPSLFLAAAQAAGGGRAYAYELTWPAPGMDGVFGSSHGLDVPLVLGNLDSERFAMVLGPEPSAEAWALSEDFRTAWTAFAATGDPGWPAYDAQARTVRVFDAEPAVGPYPEAASLDIWKGHRFAALTLV